MADKYKDELLSEEQLNEVNGGLVKEGINVIINRLKEIQTTIDSDEYQMLSDSQKNIAFMMAVEKATLAGVSSIPGIGDAFSSLNKIGKDMSPSVRTTAEQALDAIIKIAERVNSENPF